MPTVKFSNKELEYLKEGYLAELKAATEYVEEIRKIIAKLGGGETLPKKTRSSSPPERKKEKKRGRPRVEKTVIAATDDSKSPAEKKKRGRPRQEKKVVQNQQEIKASKVVKAAPKKKISKRRKPSGNWGGVRLANLSKPLKKPAPVVKEEVNAESPTTTNEIPTDFQ